MGLTKNKIILLILFFLTFVVYLKTLAPTITSEDSGDFINCAKNLVMAHPTGYPLYCFTGKIFTLLPVKTTAFRVNLMSAFFASLASMILYLIIRKLTKNNLVAFTASLLFAFSNSVWSQAVIAEVYTMNLFFFALLTYLALLYNETKSHKIMLYFAFFYGLSLTNHVMNLFYLPAFIFLFRKDLKYILKKEKIAAIAVLFLIGLSFYAYIPISISKTKGSLNQIPYYNPDKSLSSNFFEVITAKIYRSQTEFSIKPINLYHRTKSLFFQLFTEIYFLILISLVGIFYLSRTNKPLLIFLLMIILIDFLYTDFINIYPMYITKYGILALFALIILTSYGILYLLAITRISEKKSSYFLLIIIFIPLIMNYGPNNQSQNWFTYNYGKDILTTIPEKSFLYILADDSYYPISFHLNVDKVFSKRISAFYEGAIADKRAVKTSINKFINNENGYSGMFYVPDFRNLEIQHYREINNPFTSFYDEEAFFRQYGILYLFSANQTNATLPNPWNNYNNSGFEVANIPKNYLDSVRIIFYYQMVINQFQDKDIMVKFAAIQLPHIKRAISIINKSYSGFINEEKALLILNFLYANSNMILKNDKEAKVIRYKLEHWDLINPQLDGLKRMLSENLR